MKIVLIIIAVIVAIPFVLALFVSNTYDIKREIVINKNNQAVFNYVKYLKNQNEYSKWVMMDPTITKQYKGTDGTPGFVFAWDGKKSAGKGEQEIKSLKEGELVDVEIRFQKPFEGVAQAPIIIQSISPDQTKVIWGMSGKNKYPFNFMNLFNDKILGGPIQESLALLKSNVEKL